MPELPEVEVTRRGLLSDLPDRLVTAIRCGRLRLRAPLPAALLRTHIAGQRITTIDRRAKYLLFRMASGAVLVAHLGMTGKFGVMAADAPLHKHDVTTTAAGSAPSVSGRQRGRRSRRRSFLHGRESSRSARSSPAGNCTGWPRAGARRSRRSS
jgi:formamidopyrimidine-DNA glycosylase